MKVAAIFSLCLYVCLTNATGDFHGTTVKIVSQSRFRAPVNAHLIDKLTNIRSLLTCVSICHRHVICRTADYDSVNHICRLFETFSPVGTLISNPNSTVLMFNYCTNDFQTEPEYICTRTNTYTVQHMFDQLALTPVINLTSVDQGAYGNMYGVYTSSSSGSILFFNYTGVAITLAQLNTTIIDVNSAVTNGLSTVQSQKQLAIIYQNIGTLSHPKLSPTLNFTLNSSPCSILMTSKYFYVAYMSYNIIMTIHNLSDGSVLFSIPSNVTTTRPVIREWNDTIFVIDQFQITKFTTNGTVIEYVPYFDGFRSNRRHFIYFDYAGRMHTCNRASYHYYSGIYTFFINGTRLANGPSDCDRAFQVYITKEQAILVNIQNGGLMQVINF